MLNDEKRNVMNFSKNWKECANTETSPTRSLLIERGQRCYSGAISMLMELESG